MGCTFSIQIPDLLRGYRFQALPLNAIHLEIRPLYIVDPRLKKIGHYCSTFALVALNRVLSKSRVQPKSSDVEKLQRTFFISASRYLKSVPVRVRLTIFSFWPNASSNLRSETHL